MKDEYGVSSFIAVFSGEIDRYLCTYIHKYESRKYPVPLHNNHTNNNPHNNHTNNNPHNNNTNNNPHNNVSTKSCYRKHPADLFGGKISNFFELAYSNVFKLFAIDNLTRFGYDNTTISTLVVKTKGSRSVHEKKDGSERKKRGEIQEGLGKGKLRRFDEDRKQNKGGGHF